MYIFIVDIIFLSTLRKHYFRIILVFFNFLPARALRMSLIACACLCMCMLGWGGWRKRARERGVVGREREKKIVLLLGFPLTRPGTLNNYI